MYQLAQVGHHLMLRARSTSRRRPFHSRPSMWRTACTSKTQHYLPSCHCTAHTIGEERKCRGHDCLQQPAGRRQLSALGQPESCLSVLC